MCVDETLMCSFKKIKQEKLKRVAMGKKSRGPSPGLQGKRVGTKYGK